jgi:hypothetical protein
VDAATRAAFATLRRQVDRRFVQVDRRFEQVDRRFEQVDRRLEQVDRRFEQVDQRLDRLESAVGDLREHVDATAVDTRREFHIVEEGLRRDMQLLAEGFTLRMDRLENTLREQIVRSCGDLAVLIRLGYTDLDRRVTTLEQRSPASG